MKYEDEVFSKESVMARRNNKVKESKKIIAESYKTAKAKRNSELLTVALFMFTVMTIVSLTLIDICGL